MQLQLTQLAIAAILAIPAMGVRVEHGGLPFAGGGGSTGCIPICRVYAEGARGCNGVAEFTGHCNQRSGDTVRPLGGCGDGVDVRWIADGNNGLGILQVRDPTGFDEMRVTSCDSATPTSGRCTFDGGCSLG